MARVIVFVSSRAGGVLQKRRRFGVTLQLHMVVATPGPPTTHRGSERLGVNNDT